MWDTLKLVYQPEEVNSKNFLFLTTWISKWLMKNQFPTKFFELIPNEHCCWDNAWQNFCGTIISKPSPSWKDYSNKLKHKKDDLTLDKLLQWPSYQRRNDNLWCGRCKGKTNQSSYFWNKKFKKISKNAKPKRHALKSNVLLDNFKNCLNLTV